MDPAEHLDDTTPLLLLIFLVFHTQATQLGVVLEEGVSLHASPFEDSKALQPLKAGQKSF